MSGNENNDGSPVEVPNNSSIAVVPELTDDSKSAASNEVNDVRDVEMAAASVVDEAKPSVSDANSEARNLFWASVPNVDLMKASNLHCPFVWKNDLDTSQYLDHEIDLLSSAEELFDDLGFRFRRYIVHLVMSYHNFYKRNIKECMEHLDELENMMMHSSKKNCNDYLFNTINDALFHVIHSCRIYIFDTTEQRERTQQILNKIKSYDSMNNANKAGLWAIRANVYVEYGYEGVKNAVSYIRKAVNLDPNNAFWHFMKGMFMGRLRRMEGTLIMPENEEFEALSKAMDKREDPAFIAFAGETYMETAKTAKRMHTLVKSDKDAEKQVVKILQDLNEVAAKYFKRSIELKPNSSHLLFRCGKGLINLPPPHQDLKLGLEFLRKGLDICPDSGYGNHAMAMFLDKIEKNPTLAKEYLDISIMKKNFPAHLDLIRLEFQESKNAQKLWEELEKMLKLYNEMPRKRKILGEMVCYHLFIDYDLVEACFYMKKLIQLNSTSIDIINNHKSMILPIVMPIPLSDLIFNRINASLKDRKLSDLSRQVFTKYVYFLIDENIEPTKIHDDAFTKVLRQIELGFKNKKMKPVDERVRDAQKRVRSANEFEADPCAEEELDYLHFYKDDLKDTKVGKARGVGDDMMNILHKMGQNPLPKRRVDEDMSDGDRRREKNGRSSRSRDHDRERSRSYSSESSSRKHRRRRSYSSSSSSRSSYSSSDRRSYRKHRRSSRNRRRSPSSESSYSSYSSSSSDRYSKSRRRKDHRRRSSSYDSKRSRNKHHRRGVSPDAKSRHQKSRRDRSPSQSITSTSSGSETSASSRSGSTLSQRSKKETIAKKPADVSTGAEAEVSHPVEQSQKNDGEALVDLQAALDNLSIDSHKSSRKSSPQPTSADASKDVPNVSDAKHNSQNGEARHSDKVEGSDLNEKSSKRRENREDSDGSVKTSTSRTSGASKRSSKRRSRDRSVDSARTNHSRSSKSKGKSSRKRRSSSSSSRSSSRDRRSERSSSRRHQKSEQRLINSPDLIRLGDLAPANRSERRSKDDGRKDRDRKHRKDADSDASSYSSRRNRSDKNRKADRRSLPKESEDDDRRRPRKEKDDRDRRSKTVSSQSSD